MSKHQELLKEFGYFAQSTRTVEALMEKIVQRLHDTMTRYNWVGFYLVDKVKPGHLVLGPHVGSFEPHESISLHKGLSIEVNPQISTTCTIGVAEKAAEAVPEIVGAIRDA